MLKTWKTRLVGGLTTMGSLACLLTGQAETDGTRKATVALPEQAAAAKALDTGLPSAGSNRGGRPMSDEKRKRIADIRALLAEHPAGVGRVIADRAAWEAFGAEKRHQEFIQEAERLLTTPMPELTDDLYLEYSRTGKRTGWQGAAGQRHRRLKPLVLAECIENKGRFLPAIEQLIGDLCAERTWVLPAHDTDLRNFNRERISIDLWSSAFAWDLATTDWLLGDRLSAPVRKEIRDNIRWRILEPFRRTMARERGINGWAYAKHNWNAVCLAGVAGSVLQQVESPDERAEFLEDIIEFSKNYLKGYEEDGYCGEGLGYWNYGMSHYVLLAQMIRQATGEGIDLIDEPLVSEIAKFGMKSRIINEVYPAFSDCDAGAKPNHNLMVFANRRWGLGLSQYQEPVADGTLSDTMIHVFDVASSTVPPPPDTAGKTGLRDWFDKSGVLIARPAAGSSRGIGVALKGGHNGETHNHNDVGSYVVALGNKAVLLDPGNEHYTARTFSARRYESKLINSFGHPVPVVAGQLQSTGVKARAEIRKVEFSDKTDLLEMEMRSAYAVDDLRSLVRTFVYSREGQGTLTVTDKVELSSPQSFGTALITAGNCRRTGDHSLLVQSGEETLRVTIDTDGEPFEIKIEQIKEYAPVKPHRIGIDLVKPVTAARIRVVIEPASPD